MIWEKELMKLWEKRSQKQEEEGGDVIVDFDNLMIDVKKVMEKELRECLKKK